MKTLEQIKDDYAASKEYSDWGSLITSLIFSSVPKSTVGKLIELEKHMDNICIIAQKECLKLGSENVEVNCFHGTAWIEAESITNENNIIK